MSDSYKDLCEVARELPDEELRVVLLIAKRIRGGLNVYGPLDLANDSRDLRKDACEEWADAAVYSACEMLRDAMRAGK